MRGSWFWRRRPSPYLSEGGRHRCADLQERGWGGAGALGVAVVCLPLTGCT